MCGREICIKNDWRIGDTLKQSIDKMSGGYNETVIITSIGKRDVMVMGEINKGHGEWITDFSHGKWELVKRPRKLVGFAFRYGARQHLRTIIYPSIPSLKAMEDSKNGKLISVWKVAAKVKPNQKWEQRS